MKVYEASVDPDAEPIPFALKIVNVKTNEVLRLEEFQAAANPGSGADFTLASVSQVINGKQVIDAMGLLRFFKRVLVGDSYDRLQALIDDDNVGIPSDLLGQVITDLMEEWSGRPTQPSKPSSGGPPTTGVSSTPPASLIPA